MSLPANFHQKNRGESKQVFKGFEEKISILKYEQNVLEKKEKNRF
jgi:hypothetical protein